jgi:hypothetical protein
MIQTYGHHTIENNGEKISNRIKIGPVKSLVLDEEGKPKKRPPFVGDGYYFWEDNLDAAEWWGGVHYTLLKKEYRIFRIDLTLDYADNSFFDLVGNRQHLKLLAKLIDKTKKKIDCDGWVLHNYIAYWKVMNSRTEGVFPYKMIRFNDSNMNPKIQMPISLRATKNMTLLNPFYIVCVFDLEDIALKSFIFIK